MSAPVVAALVAALTVTSAACSRDKKPATPAAAQLAGVPQPSRTSAPPASAPAEGEIKTITGRVTETMDAGTYTYVRVKTDTDEVWAASSRFTVAVGDRVTVPLETPMENFHSQTLNRDFPLIYFASQISREGEAPAAGALPAGMHPAPKTVTAVTERIAPPAGGTSVADVWSQRKALGGKLVTVRGKVVKYNGGILGVNWLHIQDGSGQSKDNTNDLAITTTDEAKVGDIVTASGKVSVDKDFGAGYAYPVIVEGAKITR